VRGRSFHAEELIRKKDNDERRKTLRNLRTTVSSAMAIHDDPVGTSYGYPQVTVPTSLCRRAVCKKEKSGSNQTKAGVVIAYLYNEKLH
jgi:hypothetical protein